MEEEKWGAPRDISTIASPAPSCNLLVLSFHAASRLPIPPLPPANSHQPCEITPNCFFPALSNGTSLSSQTEVVYKTSVWSLCAVPIGNTVLVPRHRAVAITLWNRQWHFTINACVSSLTWVTAEELGWTQIMLFFAFFLRINFSPEIVISAICLSVQYSKNFLPSSQMMYVNMCLTTLSFQLNIQNRVKLKGINKDYKALYF